MRNSIDNSFQTIQTGGRARPYIAPVQRAGFNETAKSALEKSVKSNLSLSMPMPMPIPMPIAERDCIFAQFVRFAGAVSLNPALWTGAIYGLPEVGVIYLFIQTLSIYHLKFPFNHIFNTI